MGKRGQGKKGSIENPITSDDIANLLNAKPLRSFDITNAQIKDDFCHYSYEINDGVGIGDVHNVKGKGIVKDDMKEAFAKFNVHLAVIDDAFKNSGIEIEDIDQMHSHELTFGYVVTGFAIRGSKENESIILKGNKYVKSAGGRMELETPKIVLDNLSGYKWYNELKTAADKARDEVALYKEGKYLTPVEDETDKPDPKQIKMAFVKGEGGEEQEHSEEQLHEIDKTFNQAEA